MTLEAIKANELKALPWNEVQKMHRTLNLRQGPDGGKRADYERRILTYFTRRDELLNKESTGVTCATCQFAKHLDGNRYCCGLTDAVTRGHWEATTDCLEAIGETEAETAVAEAEAPIASTKNSPGVEVEPVAKAIEIQAQEPKPIVKIPIPIAVSHAKASEGFMAAMVKESERDREFHDILYLSQCEMEAQLAIEATEVGSKEEAIAYRCLRAIERSIELGSFYTSPVINPYSENSFLGYDSDQLLMSEKGLKVVN
jgi:hypothetical protein